MQTYKIFTSFFCEGNVLRMVSVEGVGDGGLVL